MPVAKLTPDLAEQLFALLRRGHFAADAAAYIGIHRSTLYDWRDRGAAARKLAEQRPVPEQFETVTAHRAAVTEWRRKLKAETPYLKFAEGLELARDHGAAWLVEQILDMALNPRDKQQKWGALMTILERTRRDQWGKRTAVEHGTQDGKPLQVTHTFDPSKLTDDELEIAARLFEKAQPDSQT